MASLKKTKVFIDSSVLIAAAISPRGSARELILKGIRKEVILYISDLVLEETERNLSKKVPAAVGMFKTFLKALSPKFVSPKKELVIKVSKIVDLKDAPIVAAALSAKVDYLVSFDQKHILNYKDAIKSSFNLEVRRPDLI